MGQFHFDPATYGALVRAEVPDYEEFQDAVATSTSGVLARTVLELGTGTGETTRRVLAIHDEAHLVGIDERDGMLAGARQVLPSERVELHVRRLEDPLPGGPYDLVVSALTVHHLNLPQKADLFARVRQVLRDGGRFVLGDVVVPEDPSDAVTPIDLDHDRPDSVSSQLDLLCGVGFVAGLVWQRRDLAVVVGTAPERPPPRNP
jgi:tRNA (cmo5U34)-methyltransferase